MLGNGVATEPSLGEKLKTYRTKRRLFTRELAARSGISKSLISQIERSLVNPSVASIRSLARALESPSFSSSSMTNRMVISCATISAVVCSFLAPRSSVTCSLPSTGSALSC